MEDLGNKQAVDSGHQGPGESQRGPRGAYVYTGMLWSAWSIWIPLSIRWRMANSSSSSLTRGFLRKTPLMRCPRLSEVLTEVFNEVQWWRMDLKGHRTFLIGATGSAVFPFRKRRRGWLILHRSGLKWTESCGIGPKWRWSGTSGNWKGHAVLLYGVCRLEASNNWCWFGYCGTIGPWKDRDGQCSARSWGLSSWAW